MYLLVLFYHLSALIKNYLSTKLGTFLQNHSEVYIKGAFYWKSMPKINKKIKADIKK
mgnify:CR=1